MYNFKEQETKEMSTSTMKSITILFARLNPCSSSLSEIATWCSQTCQTNSWIPTGHDPHEEAGTASACFASLCPQGPRHPCPGLGLGEATEICCPSRGKVTGSGTERGEEEEASNVRECGAGVWEEATVPAAREEEA